MILMISWWKNLEILYILTFWNFLLTPVNTALLIPNTFVYPLIKQLRLFFPYCNRQCFAPIRTTRKVKLQHILRLTGKILSQRNFNRNIQKCPNYICSNRQESSLSRMKVKYKLVLKRRLFIEKCNKTTCKTEIITYLCSVTKATIR
jgi:hypothetical protein